MPCLSWRALASLASSAATSASMSERIVAMAHCSASSAGHARNSRLNRVTPRWATEVVCKAILVILQRAREQHPEARPRLISDNGPQFIAREFKEFIRVAGMTHVRTSPYYPQSNGKIEAWHKTVKASVIRPTPPSSLDEARRVVAAFVAHYNTVRLHSAVGYLTPSDKLAGREEEIWQARDAKLDAARDRRRLARQEQRAA
jgi:transposase InsO family protein